MLRPIALFALFGFLGAEDAEPDLISYYLEEQACKACKELDAEDAAILEGIKVVENAYHSQVILYHALPFYLYALFWLWHGVSNEELVNWQPVKDLRTPYAMAEMPLALRVFGDGQQFPSFQAANGQVCEPVTMGVSVKEMGPAAQQLGVGRIMGVSGGGSKISVTYEKESKDYKSDGDGCFPLVDTAKESQAKYTDALKEEELAKNDVKSAASFVSYLTRLGVWDDTGGSTPDHIAGVRERLLSANLNVFGNWKAGWTESSWDIFRRGTTFQSFGLGGHVPFLEDIFRHQKTPPDIQETAKKQLQLLACIAKNRTSHRGTVIGCDELMAKTTHLVSCATLEDFKELAAVAPPEPEAPCKKVIRNTSPTNTKCGTDVLVQLVMDPALADQLVYVSEPGGRPDSARPGQSFMTGYNALKNRPTGDNLQARIFLARNPFASGSGIHFVAHSSVFRDTELMYALASLLSDIRDTVLGHTVSCMKTSSTSAPTTSTTTTTVWKSPLYQDSIHPIRLVAILLLAAVAVTSLCYYRLRQAAPARDPRAIEMPSRV